MLELNKRKDGDYDLGYGNRYRRIGIFELECMFKSWEKLSNRLLWMHGRVANIKKSLAFNREDTMRFFKLSPKRLHKIFRALVIKEVVDPVRKYVPRMCIRNRKLSFKYLSVLHRCIKKIKQLDRDGILYLWPVVFAYDLGPKELKQRFGKATWKRICSCSEYKLKLILSHSKPFDAAVNIPTTILMRSARGTMRNASIYLELKKMGIPFKNQRITHWNILHDTLAMAKQLGKKPKFKSWEHLNELHESYINEQLEREEKLSKEPITYDIEPFEVGGVKVTPLITPQQLKLEGKKMHHCIYSYSSEIREKKYFAVHLSSENEESTLGVVLIEGRLFGFDQHCGYCNRSPEYNSKFVKDVMKALKIRINERTVFDEVNQTGTDCRVNC